MTKDDIEVSVRKAVMSQLLILPDWKREKLIERIVYEIMRHV